MTGASSFSYFDYFDFCDFLLKSGKGESAYRTVVNRSYLIALLIGSQILGPHVTKFSRSNKFYDEVEKAVLIATRDSNLMGDLKNLRKERKDADYDPEYHISMTKAEECLLEARLFVQKMQELL